MLYLIIFIIGYEFAHSVIAKECERLGGFYFGSKVYMCKTIKSENSEI